MSWGSYQFLLDAVQTDEQGELLEVPSTRVKDCFSTRQICLRLLDNDRLRARERAKVQGLIDGNCPFDPVKLRSMGQAWRSNLNFMEGYANLQSVKTPYYALIAGVPHFAEIRTYTPDVETNSTIITEEFTKMIKEWSGFSFQLQRAQQEMLKFGIGPVFLRDPYDWRFKALRTRDLLVGEHVEGEMRDWPFFAIRTAMSAMDLWDKVRPENADAAEKLGWNLETARTAVMYASRDVFNGRVTWDSRNWEIWQDVFKNNDIYMSLIQSESVMVYHFFVKEYGGRISHFLFTETALIPDFLFKRVNRYSSMEDVLTIFRSDIGNGEYHSIRGIGRLQYQHVEVTNRLKNHIYDMAIAGTAINLKAQTQKARDELQLMQMGPINVLPPDVELVQNRVVGFLTDAMTCEREFTAHLNANLGTFQRRGVGYGAQGGGVTRPTAQQVLQDTITSTQLSEGQMVLHFLDLDLLYSQMYKRASDPNTPDKAALEFQKRCFDRKVPKIALRNIEYVRATRTAGYGSPQMRQIRSSQMMPFVGMLPESGRQSWVRDQVVSIVGPENIDRYFPMQDIETDPQYMANLENGIMLAGQHVMIPSSLSGTGHVLHAQTHLAQMEQLAQMVAPAIQQQSQANIIPMGQAAPQIPMEALTNTLQFNGICQDHVTAHLQLLSQDQLHANELQALQSRVQALAQFQAQLAALVQQRGEMMQATQRVQAGADAQNQIKMAEAQAAIQIDRAQAASKMENQRLKTMSQIQTAQQKASRAMASPRQALQREAAASEMGVSPLGAAGEEEGPGSLEAPEGADFPYG